MSVLRRVAFIGNHLPRRCGISTFTHDLHQAVSTARPALETGVVAMTDPARSYDYPSAVRFEIHDESVGDYLAAAEFLNEARFDVVCLQHEYGIFGGEAGKDIIEVLSRLDMPLVTTLHTVLAEPNPAQRDAMRQIINISTKIIVMSEKGRGLLRSVHDVPDRKIEVIPHGIPDVAFLETHQAKAQYGFTGKKVILTFGLLSPSKGIETVIDAMPGIIEACPDAVYVVLGATHPTLVRQRGEAYRESLTARVHELGIEDHVVFFDQFVDQATLLDFISMCDVYVTPYLNEAQMTSGTLAYSFGLGKAVVSTPYWHAQELLDDGRGILVPFGDVKAVSGAVAGLLTNDILRQAMRKRAYAASRSMTWAQTAERYLSVFETAREPPAPPQAKARIEPIIARGKAVTVPKMRIGHLLSLCDSTGLLQHALYSVADRSHGYCVDDNARALLLAMSLQNSEETYFPAATTARFAAFIQHAWNPDSGRFRNFMSYDRRWLEAAGSEDSHCRTLWALAECARADNDASRRQWAASLFMTALPAVESFRSPRAWAFTLLGLDRFCGPAGDNVAAGRLRKLLADRLTAALAATQSENWVWFEDVLAYDNARLCQALIQTGVTTATPTYVDAGLRSLRWLMSQQTAPAGHFRPVGTGSFGKRREAPAAFDQQPVEAAATIAACAAAWHVDGAATWPVQAMQAFAWFLGANDLHVPLVDAVTGACADGIHPDRANENKGAESALSYLLGLMEISQLRSAIAASPAKAPANMLRSIVRPLVPRTIPGSLFVPIPIPDPPELVPAPGSGEGRRAALQAGD
jgi:glycosyltransferase involved in cell wall biosynthesis